MSEICNYPCCNTYVKPGSDMCFIHDLKLNKQVKAAHKKIAIKSVKRVKVDAEYKKIVKEMLAANPYCELKSPVCTRRAEGLDHSQKRSPSNLLNRANLKRSCNACNLYKENYPEWSAANGHSISRFKTIEDAK